MVFGASLTRNAVSSRQRMAPSSASSRVLAGELSERERETQIPVRYVGKHGKSVACVLN